VLLYVEWSSVAVRLLLRLRPFSYSFPDPHSGPAILESISQNASGPAPLLQILSLIHAPAHPRYIPPGFLFSLGKILATKYLDHGQSPQFARLPAGTMGSGSNEPSHHFSCLLCDSGMSALQSEHIVMVFVKTCSSGRLLRKVLQQDPKLNILALFRRESPVGVCVV